MCVCVCERERERERDSIISNRVQRNHRNLSINILKGSYESPIHVEETPNPEINNLIDLKSKEEIIWFDYRMHEPID